MKPVRGSKRDSSKAPNAKAKSKKSTEAKKRTTAEQQESGDKGLGTQPETTRLRKVPLKAKGQENWKDMSLSSRAALENILDLAILDTLATKRAEKKDVQNHLNSLKKSFLDHCKTLKVPGQKQKQQEGSTHRLQEETKKLETERQILSSLEENLRSVVSALEKNEQETNTLEHQCSVLRNRLQDQEEEAEEIFQRKEAVLNLPPLRPAKGETTLEVRMRKIIPDTEAEATARKLGEILQNSESIHGTQQLLLLAHEQVDQLFNEHSNLPASHFV